MPGYGNGVHSRCYRCQGNKACCTAVAGTMIGKGKVVINGFGDGNCLQVIAEMLCGLSQAMGRISRVVSTDVEHVVNIITAQNSDSSFGIVLQQFIAARAKGSRRRDKQLRP